MVFSGGIDSTTLLWMEKQRADAEVIAVSFDYGQRHKRELEAAAVIADGAGVEHIVCEIYVPLPGSSQTDETVDVPEGHYEDKTMRKTVVANRNMIFLSCAAGIAVSRGARAVFYGAHAGDHAVYPDCRPEFVEAVQEAVNLGNYPDQRLQVIAPFVSTTKTDIVRLGAELGAPLNMTWSCYKGGTTHCGKCGTCVERREAFVRSGVEDRTEYEA